MSRPALTFICTVVLGKLFHRSVLQFCHPSEMALAKTSTVPKYFSSLTSVTNCDMEMGLGRAATHTRGNLTVLSYLVPLCSWTISPHPPFSSQSAIYECKHSDFKGRTVANMTCHSIMLQNQRLNHRANYQQAFTALCCQFVYVNRNPFNSLSNLLKMSTRRLR